MIVKAGRRDVTFDNEALALERIAVEWEIRLAKKNRALEKNKLKRKAEEIKRLVWDKPAEKREDWRVVANDEIPGELKSTWDTIWRQDRIILYEELELEDI